MSYNPYAGVQIFNGRQGIVTLSYSDVTGALGFTPANKAGDTFTGLLTTLASAAGGAGFNLPHGTAPTSPVNGDLWTTTSALQVRLNGISYSLALAGGTMAITGSWSFSNATLSFGTATSTSTTNVGTGATGSGATKTVNVGTGGVSGSTTNTTIGSNSGGTSNVLIHGEQAFTQTAETIKAAAATLTAAEIRTGIINYTGTGDTLTLPTGTALDTEFPFLVTDTAISFVVINTGSGTATMAVNTGVTSLGALSVAAGAQRQFCLRKTGTATYTLYAFS